MGASAPILFAYSFQNGYMILLIQLEDIDVKTLEQENKALYVELAGETLRANTGWTRYEAANKSHMNALAEILKLNERIQELESVWKDEAKLQATLLQVGFSRQNALHIAGATDYDQIKEQNELLMNEHVRIWPFIFADSGLVVHKDRFYGFGDSGGIAGSFNGYESRTEAVNNITSEDHDVDSTQAKDLGSVSVCVISGDEFIKELIARGAETDGWLPGHWSTEASKQQYDAYLNSTYEVK